MPWRRHDPRRFPQRTSPAHEDGVTYFRPNGRAAFWAAADTVVYVTPNPDVDAVVMDRNGAVQGTFAHPGLYGVLAISPDGTRAIIGLNDRRTGVGDLHLHDLARSDERRRFGGFHGLVSRRSTHRLRLRSERWSS